MCVQAAAVVEADQQVFAERIRTNKHATSKVDANQPRISGDAALTHLAGETALNLVRQPADRVTLWHRKNLRIARRFRDTSTARTRRRSTARVPQRESVTPPNESNHRERVPTGKQTEI